MWSTARFKLNLAILALVLLLSAGIKAEETSPTVPGDPCSVSTPCPKHLGLDCINGLCECPVGNVFEDGKCLRLSGWSCHPSEYRNPRNYSRTNGGDEECVKNSECSKLRNICICKKGYIENLNGTCSPVKKYGDECILDDECDVKNPASRFLKCISGTCQCDSNVSIYKTSRKNSWRDELGAGCVGLVNAPCLNGVCVEHGVCSEDEKICQCAYNFKATSTNTCAGVSGAECPCAEGFICIDNVCTCELSHLQFYDPIERTCSGYVGSPCNDKNLSCMGSAVCVIKSGNRGICECPQNSVENIYGGCELAYGSSCNENITVKTRARWDRADQCDSLAFLHCKNNVCSCVDGSIYEENTRRCAMPVGFRCDEKDSSKIFCVANAECVRSHPRLSGRCRCRFGYVKSADDTCDSTEDFEGGHEL
jgi:hypothetical protein